jgi:hypothetical protein
MTLGRTAAAGLLCGSACLAWHFPVHEQITRCAIASLPLTMQQMWAPVAEQIARRYSLYPDLIQGAKGPELQAMHRYCIKPDGKPIHNITWQPEDDLRSLAFSLDGIVDATRAGEIERSAKHAGVLAHFLQDSTCPAHALIPADSALRSMMDRFAPPGKLEMKLHPAIERSAPSIDLAGRAPRRAGVTVPQVAEALLERCYVIVRGNREKLDVLVQAVYAGDEATVDRMRREAARSAAELVADAYYSALLIRRATSSSASAMARRPGKSRPFRFSRIRCDREGLFCRESFSPCGSRFCQDVGGCREASDADVRGNDLFQAGTSAADMPSRSASAAPSKR